MTDEKKMRPLEEYLEPKSAPSDGERAVLRSIEEYLVKKDEDAGTRFDIPYGMPQLPHSRVELSDGRVVDVTSDDGRQVVLVRDPTPGGGMNNTAAVLDAVRQLRKLGDVCRHGLPITHVCSLCDAVDHGKIVARTREDVRAPGSYVVEADSPLGKMLMEDQLAFAARASEPAPKKKPSPRLAAALMSMSGLGAEAMPEHPEDIERSPAYWARKERERDVALAAAAERRLRRARKRGALP